MDKHRCFGAQCSHKCKGVERTRIRAAKSCKILSDSFTLHLAAHQFFICTHFDFDPQGVRYLFYKQYGSQTTRRGAHVVASSQHHCHRCSIRSHWSGYRSGMAVCCCLFKHGVLLHVWCSDKLLCSLQIQFWCQRNLVWNAFWSEVAMLFTACLSLLSKLGS